LPIIILITAFSSLVGMGGAPQAAIAMGQNDNDKAEKILGNCLTFTIVLAILLTAVILITKNDLLILLGASSETLTYGLQYLTIYTYGTIFIQFVLALNPFITTQGFAQISMKTTLLGAIINIILDPIFIFVLNLGVQGAAIATVLSQGISAVWVFMFLTGDKTLIRIRRKNLMPDKKIMLTVMALGVSPFIMQGTESILTICYNTSLQKFGGDFAVGAMTILASCMQFSMLPLMGITQGAQPIISYNFGAGNMDRVRKTFKLLVISSMVFTTVMWLIIMFMPQVFAMMFTSSASLSTVTVWSLRIYMAVSLLFGIQLACQQTFIALGDAKTSVFLALLRKVFLLIPLIYILPAVLPESISSIFVTPELYSLLYNPHKVFAIFLSEPVADFMAVTVTAILFKINFKKILDSKGRGDSGGALPRTPQFFEKN
ncbi:MAG: MATE family efflux transporter, partial [Anaerotignaceae bacterium]